MSNFLLRIFAFLVVIIFAFPTASYAATLGDECRRGKSASCRALCNRGFQKACAKLQGIKRQNKPIRPKSITELPLFESTPWLVKNEGPENRKGVIYYIRGWGYGTTRQLDSSRIVPYFLKTLSEKGWDVIHAKIPVTNTFYFMRKAAWRAGHFLKRRVEELKKTGYQRVVIAGHDWGAWVAMSAAQDRDFYADSLILHSPDGWGKPVKTNGKINPRFKRNLTEFRGLIDGIKIPTVLIVFAGNEYELGERGKIAQKKFDRNNIANLIIDKPAGFTGHSTGWMPVFDYVFGHCIQSFLEKPRTQSCQPRRISNSDFRSVVLGAQLDRKKLKFIFSGEGLLGRQYLTYPIGHSRYWKFDYVSPTRREIVAPFKVWQERVDFREGLHCVKTNCSILVRWSEDVILEFNPKTDKLKAWWIKL